MVCVDGYSVQRRRQLRVVWSWRPTCRMRTNSVRSLTQVQAARH